MAIFAGSQLDTKMRLIGALILHTVYYRRIKDFKIKSQNYTQKNIPWPLCMGNALTQPKIATNIWRKFSLDV